MMTPFEIIESRFTDWNYGHPKLLYGLIRMLQPESVVEVGTYRGYAACYMARALQENGKGHLWCIDDFSEGMQKKYDANHWHENIKACGVQDFATLLIGKSDDVQWPERVDIAYIDGWHSYQQAERDFNNCRKRGANVVCFDDIISTVGIRQLVADLDRSIDWHSIELMTDNGLAICVRTQSYPRPATFSQEIPGIHGTIMKDEAEIAAHLDEAREITGISYDEVL